MDRLITNIFLLKAIVLITLGLTAVNSYIVISMVLTVEHTKATQTERAVIDDRILELLEEK